MPDNLIKINGHRSRDHVSPNLTDDVRDVLREEPEIRTSTVGHDQNLVDLSYITYDLLLTSFSDAVLYKYTPYRLTCLLDRTPVFDQQSKQGLVMLPSCLVTSGIHVSPNCMT